MLSLSLHLSGVPQALAEIADVKAAFTDGRMAAAVEVAMVAAVRDNFHRLAQIPNKLGAPSTNFWLRAADSTESSHTGDAVRIVITQRGVALQWKGGTVRPKNVSEITGQPIKFLTIPKVAEAHGKTVAILRSLGVDLYPAKGGLRQQLGESKDPDGDRLWFVLARSATIKANPAVIPSEAALKAAGEEAVKETLAALTSS